MKTGRRLKREGRKKKGRKGARKDQRLKKEGK
jgi:hypothetical protein